MDSLREQPVEEHDGGIGALRVLEHRRCPVGGHATVLGLPTLAPDLELDPSVHERLVKKCRWDRRCLSDCSLAPASSVSSRIPGTLTMS